MKFDKNILVIFFIVILTGVVSASNVRCDIVNDKVLVEVSLSDGANIILPKEYSLLESNGKTVSFISRSFLKEDDGWVFVLPRVVNGNYSLEVYLPRNHILTDGLVYPKGYDISSDGTNIILNWKNLSGDEVIVFYEGASNSYFWYWIIIFGLIALGIFIWYFQKKSFYEELKRLKKKKDMIKKKDISVNLFGEEKRIVEFLTTKKGRSCWMKEIVRELGISKVMASRKVRGLVEKGIVSREPFGRENKISLK